MALRHYNLTLDGTVQQLTEVLSVQDVGGSDDRPLRFVILQPDGGNGNVIYVGSANSITSSDYGFRLEAAVGAIPPAPMMMGEFETGPLKLSQFFVLGTDTEILHILTLDY